MKEHKWVKTIPDIPSYKSCSECGKSNNPENIDTECKPLLKVTDKVKVKMETRFFIECPNGCCEMDVDINENGVSECPVCNGKWFYNSDPSNCETV